jgi:uncharacterized protein (DUF58 family)
MWFRRIFLHGKQTDHSTDKSPLKTEGSSVVLSPGVFRQLDRLELRSSRELGGDRFGTRSSNRRKPSTEFIEHRRYVPGDDIRNVDWRASARQEGFLIRQGELTKEVNVAILVDCSASMHWGDPPKSVLQKKLATMLAYLALTQGDRLSLHPYGGNRNRALGPISGKMQFSQVLRYLENLNYGGEADLSQGLSGLRKKNSQGGILFVLSDLLEPGNLTNILSIVPAPVWWVNIFHLLHPHETNPEINGSYELVDSETLTKINYDLTAKTLRQYQERISTWQQNLVMACVESHSTYSIINTSASLEKEVLPQLRAEKVVVNR